MSNGPSPHISYTPNQLQALRARTGDTVIRGLVSHSDTAPEYVHEIRHIRDRAGWPIDDRKAFEARPDTYNVTTIGCGSVAPLHKQEAMASASEVVGYTVAIGRQHQDLFLHTTDSQQVMEVHKAAIAKMSITLNPDEAARAAQIKAENLGLRYTYITFTGQRFD